MPTAVAIQCVEVTTPNVPSISGRVVNGLGLMLPAMNLVLSGDPYSTVIAIKKCRCTASGTSAQRVAPLLSFRSIMGDAGTRATTAAPVDRPRRRARAGQGVHCFG